MPLGAQGEAEELPHPPGGEGRQPGRLLCRSVLAGSPGEGHRRQAEGPAVLGEGVLVRAEGGPCRLPGAAEGGRGVGGEQGEGGQGAAQGQFVQVPGGVRAGAQGVREVLRRRGQHDRLGRAFRHVHHRGRLPAGGQQGQRGGQGVAVRGRALRDQHLGVRAGQRPRHLLAAADEQQPAGAVDGDEVLGGRGGEVAAPGDDHGARGVGCRRLPRVLLRCGAGQPGHQGFPAPHRDLLLPRRRRGGQGEQRGGIAVHVDQGDPARMLRLRAAHQPPSGRRGEVLDVVEVGGDRVPGHHEDPAVGCRLVGQQCAQRAEQRLGVLLGEHDECGRPVVADRVRHPACGVERSGRVHRVTEHRPVGRVLRGVGGGRLGQGEPVEAVQPVVPLGGGAGQGDRGDGPDARHRGARHVGQRQGAAAVVGGPDADAERGGARGVQGDAPPRPGDGGSVLCVLEQRAQGGVQQDRVDAERGGFAGEFVGQSHLGVEVVAQSPEGGRGGRLRVVAGRLGHGARRGPGREVLRLVRGCLGEDARRQPGPRTVQRLVVPRVLVRPCGQHELPASVARGRRAGRQLQIDSAARRDGDRRPHRHLLHDG